MTKIPVYNDEDFTRELRSWQEGVKYPALVISATKGTSKAGNEMAIINFQVCVENDIRINSRKWYPYIPIEVDRRKHFGCLQRLKMFLTTLGLPFNDDSLDRIGLCEGRELKVKLKPNEKGFAEIDEIFPVNELNETKDYSIEEAEQKIYTEKDQKETVAPWDNPKEQNKAKITSPSTPETTESAPFDDIEF